MDRCVEKAVSESRPTKEAVRQWLHSRWATRQPPPEPAAVRQALKLGMAQAQFAEAAALPVPATDQ